MAFPIEREDCLAMRWPGGVVDSPSLSPADRVRAGLNQAGFHRVQSECGFATSEGDWADIEQSVAPAHRMVALREGVPVGAAVAHRRQRRMFELGWVAVVPAHRGPDQ